MDPRYYILCISYDDKNNLDITITIKLCLYVYSNLLHPFKYIQYFRVQHYQCQTLKY